MPGKKRAAALGTGADVAPPAKKAKGLAEAKKQFCKKFQDKTKNAWEKRADFKAKTGN
eukprot:gene48983-37259_t